MASKSAPISKTWRFTHGDLTDEEWSLICDLFPAYGGDGLIAAATLRLKKRI